jgi:hypothetical protein
MESKRRLSWKGILVAILAGGVLVVVFIIQALFAVRINPIESTPPPAFIGSHIQDSADSVVQDNAPEPEPNSIQADSTPEIQEPENPKAPKMNQSQYNDLAKSVVLDGQPHAELIDLLSSPDPEVRIAAGHAVYKAILEFTDASYAISIDGDIPNSNWENKQRFWENVESDIEIIRGALFEVLVDSADDPKAKNWIPFALTHVPDRGDETLEILAWTSNNHASPEMRDKATRWVVSTAPESHWAREVVENRASDPSLMVRVHNLGYRFDRITNQF